METSYLLLIITCVLYGISGIIKDWNDGFTKFVNSMYVIFVVVITILTGDDGFFDSNWINYIFPIPAVLLGYMIYNDIHDGDWPIVCAYLSNLGVTATIITTSCGI